MPSKPQKAVKIVFHNRGRDPETAWCTPLAKPDQFRLDNILFLHARPVYGDVVLARPARVFDGALAFRRVVKPSGRYAMIVDYPDAAKFKKLGAFLRKSFDIESEGCFAPRGGTPGRVYLAVPKRHPAKAVFLAASAVVPGLIAIHPEVASAKKPKGETRVTTLTGAAPQTPAATKAPAPRLFDAIRTGEASVFDRLKRADMGVLDDRGRSLLFVATLEGRTEIVRKLITLGAPVNPKSPTDFAPLLAAAMRNRPVEAKLLLQAGAEPDLARDKDGDPALVTSAFRENIDVVRVLLAAPHPAEQKSLALLEAAGVGNLPIVKLLVEHGADPRWKSSLGNSALSIAKKKRKLAVVAFFASLPAD